MVVEIKDGNEVIEKLVERLDGRYAMADIVHPKTGEVMVKKDELISEIMPIKLLKQV